MNSEERLAIAGKRIPVLTLWQPWATWIAWGWKTIETRTHNKFASLLGKRIAIHAGQKIDRNAEHTSRFCIPPRHILDMGQMAKLPWKTGEPKHRGSVIATAEVSEIIPCCNTLHTSPSLVFEVEGLVGYTLKNVRAFPEPIPAKGKQGIWYWESPFPICRVCGCTEFNACNVGLGDTCHWVADDLCSACVTRGVQI